MISALISTVMGAACLYSILVDVEILEVIKPEFGVIIGLIRLHSMQRRALALTSVFAMAGATENAVKTFLRLDKCGTGFIDQKKMIRGLSDMGVFEGVRAKALGNF